MAISAGKVSKNQTAAQRAAAADVPSGKKCGKCSQAIKIKDLLNVKQVDHTSGRNVTVAYHRNCYGF